MADEKPKYHKAYNIDQAGLGVIAIKDVEAFPTYLIKKRRSKPWRFQRASHENLVSLLDFYESHSLTYLVYEYEHLLQSETDFPASKSFFQKLPILNTGLGSMKQ